MLVAFLSFIDLRRSRAQKAGCMAHFPRIPISFTTLIDRLILHCGIDATHAIKLHRKCCFMGN